MSWLPTRIGPRDVISLDRTRIVKSFFFFFIQIQDALIGTEVNLFDN